MFFYLSLRAIDHFPYWVDSGRKMWLWLENMNKHYEPCRKENANDIMHYQDYLKLDCNINISFDECALLANFITGNVIIIT